MLQRKPTSHKVEQEVLPKCSWMKMPTSHNGSAQDWKSWSFGTRRFDSCCGRLQKIYKDIWILVHMKNLEIKKKDSNSYHLFFSNLANPLKIKILLSLRNKEKNVTKISQELDVEQSKISHALASLKNCRIANYTQKGKERIYSLNKKTIVPILKLIEKHASVNCRGKCCIGKKCRNCN